MATGTSNFSVKPNFRLEFSANVTGWRWIPANPPVWDGYWSARIEMVAGVRRMSGADTSSGSSTLEWSRSIVGGGGMAGEGGIPFSFNFADTDYVEVFRTYTEAITGEQWQFTVSVPESGGAAIPLGTASVTTPPVDVPPPTNATQVSFTPEVFTAGTPISIKWSGSSAAYTHELYYSFGTQKDIYIAGALPQSSAGYSYTPPLSLISEIPNAPQGAYRISLVTKQGSTVVGTTHFDGTLLVPNTQAPTVDSYTITDTNGSVQSIVGAYVQRLSTLSVTAIDATPVAPSTIVNRRLEIEGQSLQIGGTRLLASAGTVPLVAKAWDSRGLVGQLPGSISVLSYGAPAVPNAPGFYRFDGTNPADNGTRLRGSLVAAASSLMNGTERNSLTIKIETRSASSTGVWTQRNLITPAGLAYSGNIDVGGGAIYAANEGWDIRTTVSDKFNSVIFVTSVGVGEITIDLNGSKVGVGKAWQQGALDVGGDTYVGGKVVATGDINAAGDMGATKMRLSGVGDASTTSTNHAFQIGDTAAQNLIIDNNEIMVRNNGVVNRLYIEGGLNTGGSSATQGGIGLSLSDSRMDATHYPYGMAAGAATTSAAGAVTVTFPSGRFSVAPRVTIGAVNPGVNVTRGAVSSTSVTFNGRNNAGGALAADFDWTAVQMSAGSASG